MSFCKTTRQSATVIAPSGAPAGETSPRASSRSVGVLMCRTNYTMTTRSPALTSVSMALGGATLPSVYRCCRCWSSCGRRRRPRPRHPRRWRASSRRSAWSGRPPSPSACGSGCRCHLHHRNPAQRRRVSPTEDRRASGVRHHRATPVVCDVDARALVAVIAFVEGFEADTVVRLGPGHQCLDRYGRGCPGGRGMAQGQADQEALMDTQKNQCGRAAKAPGRESGVRQPSMNSSP